MLWSVRLIRLSLLLLVLAGAASAVAAMDLPRYCNSRFGFCVDYPQGLEMDPPPADDDGRRFHSPDGFLMVASGVNNSFKGTVQTEMLAHKEEFDTISYREIGRNWYIMTGFKGADSVYLKTYVGNGSINHLYVRCPKSLMDRYKTIVTSIFRSFAPGQINVSH